MRPETPETDAIEDPDDPRDLVIAKTKTKEPLVEELKVREGTGEKLLRADRFISHTPDRFEQILLDQVKVFFRKWSLQNWAHILGKGTAEGIMESPRVMYWEMWQEGTMLLRTLVGSSDPVDLRVALRELSSYLAWVEDEPVRDRASLLGAMIGQLLGRVSLGLKKREDKSIFDVNADALFEGRLERIPGLKISKVAQELVRK